MMSFTHFTDLAVKYSLSRHLAVMTSHLMNALARYKVASFSNDVISLALTSLHLETITRDPGTWTYISRQLQSLTQVSSEKMLTNSASLNLVKLDLAFVQHKHYAEKLILLPNSERNLKKTFQKYFLKLLGSFV